MPHLRRRRPGGRSASFRRGAAAVEFALVAPIFLFALIIPMVEFGRGMMVVNALSSAAKTGCRTGVLPSSDNSAIATAVANSLSAQGIQGANPIEVRVNGTVANASTAMQGDAISVTVSVPMSNVSWLPLSLTRYLGNQTLSQTEVMRRE